MSKENKIWVVLMIVLVTLVLFSEPVKAQIPILEQTWEAIDQNNDLLGLPLLGFGAEYIEVTYDSSRYDYYADLFMRHGQDDEGVYDIYSFAESLYRLDSIMFHFISITGDSEGVLLLKKDYKFAYTVERDTLTLIGKKKYIFVKL